MKEEEKEEMLEVILAVFALLLVGIVVIAGYTIWQDYLSAMRAEKLDLVRARRARRQNEQMAFYKDEYYEIEAWEHEEDEYYEREESGLAHFFQPSKRKFFDDSFANCFSVDGIYWGSEGGASAMSAYYISQLGNHR